MPRFFLQVHGSLVYPGMVISVFFGRIVSCKSAICTSLSCSNFTSSIFLFCSPLMFSWRIFSSSLAYFSQGAGDRTPLRGPFSPRRHPSSFLNLCEPGIVRFGGFCYGRLPPKASSKVDSNCGIHFWGLYFSCWDQFRLWFVAVLSRRHSPLVMGPCGRLCLIHFTSPGLVTHHDRVTSCLHRFCQSWHLFPVATVISYRLSVFLMSKVLWWGVQYQIPTGYPP